MSRTGTVRNSLKLAIGVATVGAISLATACTTPASTSPTASSAIGGAATAPSASAPAELGRFYGQRPEWAGCGRGVPAEAVCAWVEVPIDYAVPTGETVKLRVLRLPARGGKASRGALLVNPGGPGGSAIEYAANPDGQFSPQVLRNFDIVGFDPRGVGASNPIECVEPRAMDALMGFDPTPDDAAERAEGARLWRDFGKACQARFPRLLGHVSTVEAARDMDVVRAVLGQPKLNYLGKSYGTFLGATYAGLFPGTVNRMVLDGSVPPDLTDVELNLGQAVGFESATRAYVADCVAERNCPLGGDVESGMTRIRAFLTALDARPLPVRGDPVVTQLTEGWGSVALAQAMYDQGQWRYLTPSLVQAFAGDGTALFAFAKAYADRNSDGSYSGNIMQVIGAVNCLDRGGSVPSDADRDRMIREFTAKAPTWGRYMVSGSATCQTWPVPQTGKIAKVSAAGSPPIVVVGTTRDPATPFEWSQRLAAQLQNGHLITWNGDGHTAYMRSNNCVDKAVDAYLMDGTVPANGLTC